MSGRARHLAFVLCAAALVVAVAALIALRPSETPAEPPETTSRSSSGHPPEFEELEQRAQARQQRAEPRIERNGVAEDEREPPVPPVWERTRRVAGPVARRFFSAYSLYEIGELDASVRRELTATTDPGFLQQLLAAPPRVPAGARPPRAKLGRRLQLIPGAQDAPQAEPASIELVGDVRRAGEGTELLAISMGLIGGRWSVSGLGR